MKLPKYRLPNFLISWLPLALLATILALLVYVAVQQQVRLAANDVPVQLAQDVSLALSQGQTPSILSAPPIDIAASLAPFVVIYNEKGVPTGGFGHLHAKLPVLPAGVLAYARHHNDDRVTWQPQAGVRVASVVKHYSGRQSGFVLAGRSLREIEKREQLLGVLVVGGWLTALLSTLLVVGVLNKMRVEHAPRKT